ncbi:MAG: hypothetical protein KAR20_07010, partial [Candidatus Heimdallarchaeota archaeon]|nr:hypothetical protein [Candidatus Heimdallarchaeota archaeon]
MDNGEYVVYMMIEDPGFWEYYQNYNQRKVFAEGQVVIDEKLLPEEFFEKYYFGHLNYEDLPGRDVFKDYVTKRFVWRKFETKVEDGQLTLQFDSADAYANTLSALIVAPLENDHNVKGYLEGLNSKRKTFFEGLYIESRGDASQVSEGLRKEYLEKGFVPFEKNYNDPMLPSDAPTKSQLTDKISLIVFQNEYEPFVVGFYPLKDVGVLSLSISDLKNSAGQVFSKRNIKMNYVQYKLKLTESHIYTMRGELLRDINKFNLSSGVTRYGWFTVYVPKGTNPGVYKGKVNVVSRGPNNESRIESDFDLEIKILPFELDEPDIPIGLFYSLPFQYDWYPTMKGLKWTAIERQLKDMRDHGINTLALGLSPRIRSIDANGNVELDFRYFDEFLHVYKHFGFNQPVSGYGLISIWKEIKKRTAGDSNLFEKSIVSAFSQIKAHAKMYSGNDIVIVLADEVSNTGGEGIDSIKKVARILKDSGLNATGYFNYKNDREIFPYLRTVTITNGLGISEDLLKYAKKSNTDVWFYNIGQNRFTFGYYLWKTKVKGRLQWHYQLPAVDPYFDLDGRESD